MAGTGLSLPLGSLEHVGKVVLVVAGAQSDRKSSSSGNKTWSLATI